MSKIFLRLYLGLISISLVYWLSCNAMVEWANYQVEQKNPREALRFYRIVGQIAPGFPDIFIWQGWRECELGNYAEARSLAEQARRHNPRSVEVAHLLGQVAYAEGRFEEALEYWKDDPLGRAWAYYGMGRLEESRQCLKSCKGDEPGLDDLKKALSE
jgi:tetratricopeptide (TPR) repeat protein